MNGWIEKNEKIRAQIENKLKELPSIFTEFYIDMKGDGKSYATIKSYIIYIEHFMHYITNGTNQNDFYKNVKPVEIKKYIISLSTRNVNGTIQKTSDDYQALHWSAVNTFFEFLKSNEYIKNNPMEKTKRPKINTEHKVVNLNKQEISAVMKSIDENYTGHMRTRDKAIIGLALSTGLRVSAIVQINLEDIDFDNNIIKVTEKRAKVRNISFGENTRVFLQDWIATRNQYYGDVDTTALFLSQWKRRITTNGVRDLIAKYTKSIGKHITPHCCRKSAATAMIKNGVDISTVARILGHSSPSTTMRYIAELDEEKEKAVDIMDSLI